MNDSLYNVSAIPPDWRIRPMSEQDAQTLCSWTYPEPYHIYNFPSWEEALAEQYEIADADLRSRQYFTIAHSAQPDDLIGYIQLFPMEGLTRLGMGLRPDLCGLGLGAPLAHTAAMLALARYPGLAVDLEVLHSNERAIRAYIRAGFEMEQSYAKMTAGGLQLCCCMIYTGAGIAGSTPD